MDSVLSVACCVKQPGTRDCCLTQNAKRKTAHNRIALAALTKAIASARVPIVILK